MGEVAINWLSVLGATLVGFALGALWYGPLFGTAWMRSLGMDPEVMKNAPKTGVGRIMSITFILQWVMAYCLAMFFGTEITTLTGTLYGFLAGFAWVAFALAVNALFEQKPASYIFINGGYWTVNFTLMGVILGTWHG
jgi:hypothetical protein